MNHIEAMKQALEALENAANNKAAWTQKLAAIAAIKQALAALVQEPTVLDITIDDDDALSYLRDMVVYSDGDLTPIRLIAGDGHSGRGLYVASADYPEEGAIKIADIATTPPNVATPLAAPVQEPVAWVERWHGSGPDRGWWIWEAGLTHGNAIAYIGESDHAEQLASLIVEKHNATIATPPNVATPLDDAPHLAAQRPVPQERWVGLTKEDRVMYADLYGSYEAVLAIKAKLKEKNTCPQSS